MYSYYESLAVPAVALGCVHLFGALLSTVLYIYIKCKENHSVMVTVL